MELRVAGCWGWMLWDQVTVANLGELLDWKKGQKLAANKKNWRVPHRWRKDCNNNWVEKLIHTAPKRSVGGYEGVTKKHVVTATGLWNSCDFPKAHPMRFRPLATTMLSGNRHQIRGCFNGLEDLFKGWCFSMLLQADLSCLKTQHFVLKCFFQKSSHWFFGLRSAFVKSQQLVSHYWCSTSFLL